jgi:hypothetical protein
MLRAETRVGNSIQKWLLLVGDVVGRDEEASIVKTNGNSETDVIARVNSEVSVLGLCKDDG